MSERPEELDLETIKEALHPTFSGMGDMINEIIIKQAVPLLIAEVERLREDRANCMAGLKELKDNALISMRSYPMHSEGWFDFSHRSQAYENAYIRATNMLNWNGNGMSFTHFKPDK